MKLFTTQTNRVPFLAVLLASVSLGALAQIREGGTANILGGGQWSSASSGASPPAGETNQPRLSGTPQNEGAESAQPQRQQDNAVGVNGVPFPSMVGRNSSSRPSLPLSSERITNDDRDIGARLERISREVEQRMSGLRVGSGQLTPPDITSRLSELERRAAAERNIRELELREREVQAAMKLWVATFDPRKEEEARAQRTRPGSSDNAGGSTRDVADERGGGASRADRVSPQSVVGRGRDAGQGTQASTSPREPRGAPVAQAPSPQLVPLPKIVTITGGGDAGLRASLLVPYIGEVNAVAGTVLPARRRVEKITAQAVIVSDPLLGEIELGFGDAVPMAPPSASPGNTAASQRPMPIVMPPSISFSPTMMQPPAAPFALSPATPLQGDQQNAESDVFMGQ